MALSWSALLGSVSIVLISIVALIPLPQHKTYAQVLPFLLPALVVMIVIEWGRLIGAGFFSAALSFYRHPARCLARRGFHRVRGGS